MDIKNLLEVIQVQRHDFLNHLQVISGLLQLNKGERVRDYINQVCVEYENLSKITRIKSPEVKAVLLVASNEASKCQINFQFDITTNLASLDVPGEAVASALSRCIKHALKFLTPPEVTDRRMRLTISEGEKKITIKLGFPGVPAEVVKDAQEQMSLSEALAAYNSNSKMAVTEKEAEIYMIFPKK
ncbi:signal transduction histidine kinase regulating citrate/malate metabolism [Desulforamulus reducens MI-1]|uniref:Signal transduction histidine kinase regulating citrate/malate metabolism n=1 Tax=Desulforamulus reducens (strain ATCC BAA-1160 / DSM 100696 / MI-1) TaxID=349161 RepID=A4J7J0_DESRM|nr:Spo0B domain-containing protein [Desulforamulus reducens]ABO51043.1 signal transduction histidine kinase regulating citrate/malate metabolism [Desulforamulus reducens MI-1]